MRKIFTIIACTVLVIGVFAGSFYFFTFRPSQKFADTNKEAMLKISNNFIECILGDDPETCGAKYGTTEMQVAVTPAQLKLIGQKMKKNLGKLKTLSIIDKTLGWQTFSGEKGSSLTVYFQAKALFEQDESATVSCSFVRTPEWSLRLNNFRINSEQMLK